MILDAREANRAFGDPPGVKLCSAETFSNIEAPANDDYDAEYCIGSFDLKDCFHRLLMPPWMSPYFCLAPLTAAELGIIGVVDDDGKTLEA